MKSLKKTLVTLIILLSVIGSAYVFIRDPQHALAKNIVRRTGKAIHSLIAKGV